MGIFKTTKQTSTGENQVVSREVGTRFAFSRTRIIATIALVSLVAVSVGWLFVQHNTQKNTKDDPAVAVEKKLQKELNTAKTPEEKAAVYVQLSNETATASITKSVGYAKKAVATSGSVATYAQLAFTLEQAGDYAGAAAAYRKAAELSPKPANPDENTDYTYYMGRANNLGRAQ
jgi:tetratricopeptide (TPR) repeat protein